MKLLVKVGFVVAGAAACCLALAAVSSADVVEPKSALQPASTTLMSSKEQAATSKQVDPAAAKILEEVATEQAPVEDETVVATPAPETIVSQAPPHLVRQPVELPEQASVAERVTHPFRVAFQQIGATLSRVVSACETGLATGTGGPVLILGVLCMAIVLNRRRVLATQAATDEDARDLIYVWELTPPG